MYLSSTNDSVTIREQDEPSPAVVFVCCLLGALWGLFWLSRTGPRGFLLIGLPISALLAWAAFSHRVRAQEVRFDRPGQRIGCRLSLLNGFRSHQFQFDDFAAVELLEESSGNDSSMFQVQLRRADAAHPRVPAALEVIRLADSDQAAEVAEAVRGITGLPLRDVSTAGARPKYPRPG